MRPLTQTVLSNSQVHYVQIINFVAFFGTLANLHIFGNCVVLEIIKPMFPICQMYIILADILDFQNSRHKNHPDEYVPQILNIDATGQKLYEEYVSERINGDVSLWAPLKKQSKKMYLSGNKKGSVKICDKTTFMKGDHQPSVEILGLLHNCKIK